METRTRDRLEFLFLNVGHFLDHFLTLIFATVAALVLSREWSLSYDELIPYATPGMVAFGVFALPAGWLADRWSREGMMAIFFIGIGVATMLTALASTPVELAMALLVLGIFAAIYHPVGIAMVVDKGERMGMRLAVNGVWGNLGVACAAWATGFLIEKASWHWAFIVPGAMTVMLGLAYLAFIRLCPARERTRSATGTGAASLSLDRKTLLLVSGLIFFTCLIGSLIFHSMTFALPKVIAERIAAITTSPEEIGRFVFLVFACAALAQLVVGYLLDRIETRVILAGSAFLQAVLFIAFVGRQDYLALAVALGLMLSVFGQIPINDFLIGRLARSEFKARAYAARFLLGFTVASIALPMIASIHKHWGFDRLFVVLAIAACLMIAAALLLPSLSPSRSAAAARIQPAE